MSLLKQPQGVLRNILVTGGVGFIGKLLTRASVIICLHVSAVSREDMEEEM